MDHNQPGRRGGTFHNRGRRVPSGAARNATAPHRDEWATRSMSSRSAGIVRASSSAAESISRHSNPEWRPRLEAIHDPRT